LLSSELSEDVSTAFDKLGSTDKNDGKIIKDEGEEVIVVQSSSYLLLLKFCGGWWNIFALNIILLAFVWCKIKTDYTIGLWASDETI
jgi:hypothetical protein